MNRKMALMKIFGTGTAIGLFALHIHLFLNLSYKGMTTGTYSVTINSNMFYEHWIEFIMIIFGFACFILTLHYPFFMVSEVDEDE